jgi:hypothetical protein
MMLYFSPEDLNYESSINGLLIANDLGEKDIHPRDREQLNGRRVGVRGVFSVGTGWAVGSIEDIELLKAIEIRKKGRKTLPPE